MRYPVIPVLQRAIEWINARHKVFLVTLAKTGGSSPRAIGSIMAISSNGKSAGSVSSGCIESELITHLQSRPDNHLPEIIVYGKNREESDRLLLPCGAAIELAIQPISDTNHLIPLLEKIEAGKTVAYSLDIRTGATQINEAKDKIDFFYDGKTMRCVFGPSWRLLLVGAGELSSLVCNMATALGFSVTVCEPRKEFSDCWHEENTTLDLRMPDDVVSNFDIDNRCAVITLTHDPKIDDLALLEALPGNAFYVGALGSRLTNNERRKRLAQMDMSASSINKLHGPVGLPIGSKTTPEIAISIIAELIQARNNPSPYH